MYIISECLLGKKSKYNGGDNLTQDVVKFSQSYAHFDICPEAVFLPVPRDPAELIRNAEDSSFRVVTVSGSDVTREFLDGTEEALREIEQMSLAEGEAIEGAILKARSPSCGFAEIYDGGFSHTVVEGNGVFADRLLQEFENFRSGAATLCDGIVFADSFAIANENNFKEIFKLTEK